MTPLSLDNSFDAYETKLFEECSKNGDETIPASLRVVRAVANAIRTIALVAIAILPLGILFSSSPLPIVSGIAINIVAAIFMRYILDEINDVYPPLPRKTESAVPITPDVRDRV